jgi:hypothetical protein
MQGSKQLYAHPGQFVVYLPIVHERHTMPLLVPGQNFSHVTQFALEFDALVLGEVAIRRSPLNVRFQPSFSLNQRFDIRALGERRHGRYCQDTGGQIGEKELSLHGGISLELTDPLSRRTPRLWYRNKDNLLSAWGYFSS